MKFPIKCSQPLKFSRLTGTPEPTPFAAALASSRQCLTPTPASSSRRVPVKQLLLLFFLGSSSGDCLEGFRRQSGEAPGEPVHKGEQRNLVPGFDPLQHLLFFFC